MQCIRGKKNKANTCLRINLCSLLGELQLWLNNTPVPCICMCENPSAWVGFTCGGQSPLRRMHSSASEKQIGRNWIHSLFGQLHRGVHAPLPSLALIYQCISPSAAWCWAGRISRTFYCIQPVGGAFLSTSKTSVSTFCLKSLCKMAVILWTPCKALV